MQRINSTCDPKPSTASDPISSKIKLNDFWPYQVVVLADQISRYTLNIVKAKAGLNLSQWRVLAAVAEKPGRTAGDVTSVTPMDKTIVSRAVASLIQTGLIEKTHESQDRRRRSLTMTPRGLEIYENIAVHLNQALEGPIKDAPAPDALVHSLKAYSAKLAEISPKTD